MQLPKIQIVLTSLAFCFSLVAFAETPQLKSIGTVEHFYSGGNLSNTPEIRKLQLVESEVVSVSINVGKAQKAKIYLDEVQTDEKAPTYRLTVRFVSPDGRILYATKTFQSKSLAADEKELLDSSLNEGGAIQISKRVARPQK